MKKFVLLSIITALMGCNFHSKPRAMTAGNNLNSKGCIASAGYSWSVLKQQCVQPFAIADIHLADPENPTLSIFVLLSEDRANAEMFCTDLPESLILDSVKGGYMTKDNRYRLIQSQASWELKKRPSN